jgi:uncharacterized protein YndB with AHSA1/START domain
MPDVKSNTAERELRFSRLLNAPIKLVWEVWTNPKHVQHWWGPDGFTNSITKMEIRPGGEWELMMHGPDGTNYHIKIVFRDVVKYKKLVYEQLTVFKCVATIELEPREDKTFINWTMLFESRKNLIEAAKTYKVDEGLKQNAEKLISYLTQFE